MNTLNVELVQHRGERRLKLKFQYDPEMLRIVKRLNDARWSSSRHFWHIPYSDESLRALEQLIEDYDIQIPELGSSGILTRG